MKKHILALGLISSLAAAAITGSLAGCAPKKAVEPAPTESVSNENSAAVKSENTKADSDNSEDKTTDEPEEMTGQISDYEACYHTVLNFYDNYIRNFEDSGDSPKGTYGVDEILLYQGLEKGPENIGYTFRDLNQDKVPELLIGEITDSANGIASGDRLLALYTLKDGNASFLFEGWARNRYHILDDNSIYNSGSSGADASIYATYVLNDFCEPECTDCYFSSFDFDRQKVSFYHNFDGSPNIDISEELSISQEDFWKFDEENEKKIIKLDLTPMSDYEYDHQVEAYNPLENTCLLFAQYSDDFEIDYDDNDMIVAAEGQYQRSILITSVVPVKNFKFFTLSITDIAEDGSLQYTTEELYSTPELSDVHGLEVHLVFYGDMPEYGMSYEDQDGNTKTFALTQSGMDGSLVLSEI